MNNSQIALVAQANTPSRTLIVLTNSDSQQSLEETVSMALVLASFDHVVQVALTDDTAYLTHAASLKAHKMLTSLALYDMPPPWLVTSASAIPSSPLMDDIEVKTHTELQALQHAFDSVLIV